MSDTDDVRTRVRAYLLGLQARIVAAFEAQDGGRFIADDWQREAGGALEGEGRTRLLEGGAVFERAGCGFSHVRGRSLPPSATQHRPELAGCGFEAMGVSVVAHPRNPYVPTVHLNVRMLAALPKVAIGAAQASAAAGVSVGVPVGTPAHAAAHIPAPVGAEAGRQSGSSSESGPGSGPGSGSGSASESEAGEGLGTGAGAPVTWFGGGMDLTPYYGFEADAAHFHRVNRDALAPFGAGLYLRFKQWCDTYFFLKHRAEPRGIGGIFFDDFSELGFERSFEMTRAVGDGFLPAYLPIVQRRMTREYGEREREFQAYRRGRYVEFNLVLDRGTLFGLQSGGRTESILMSMPPLAAWRYDWRPAPGTEEARLYTDFLRPRDWADEPLA